MRSVNTVVCTLKAAENENRGQGPRFMKTGARYRVSCPRITFLHKGTIQQGDRYYIADIHMTFCNNVPVPLLQIST